MSSGVLAELAVFWGSKSGGVKFNKCVMNKMRGRLEKKTSTKQNNNKNVVVVVEGKQ